MKNSTISKLFNSSWIISNFLIKPIKLLIAAEQYLEETKRRKRAVGDEFYENFFALHGEYPKAFVSGPGIYGVGVSGISLLLEIIEQNIAGWCQQTFCFQKFVNNAQQCFAFTPQANFPAHDLNFHWRWMWWDWIQATF